MFKLEQLAMKNNKITAEEQNTDKPTKHCSERKACKWKWLATLCLSSGRHECITWYTTMLEHNWYRDINIILPPQMCHHNKGAGCS